MDKQSFVVILESALQSWEGSSEEKIITNFGYNSKLVKIGIKLCAYLKSKEDLVSDTETQSIKQEDKENGIS